MPSTGFLLKHKFSYYVLSNNITEGLVSVLGVSVFVLVQLGQGGILGFET